jgi:pimeloyl-ACP methyl ester carboxylesterase
MADIVMVAGAWHAGWYFNPIIPALRAHGHRAFPVTLTGLGERRHLAKSGVNLDTHIQDVLQVIEDEGAEDVMLVAHSYGGMPITGAASRLRGRVRSLVYVDAMVPADGQRMWDLVGQPFHDAFLGACSDGLTTVPPPDLDRRAAPHPLATMLQPVRVEDGTFDVANKVFVWAEGFTEGPFEPFYRRLSHTDGWETHRVPFGHDLLVEAPSVVESLLLDIAARHPVSQ